MLQCSMSGMAHFSLTIAMKKGARYEPDAPSFAKARFDQAL